MDNWLTAILVFHVIVALAVIGLVLLQHGKRCQLVEDRKPRLEPMQVAEFAQEFESEGVKGADPHPVGASNVARTSSLDQFPGRLVGESQDHDLVRRNTGADEPPQAKEERRRLASPGPCLDQTGRSVAVDSRLLSGSRFVG